MAKTTECFKVVTRFPADGDAYQSAVAWISRFTKVEYRIGRRSEGMAFERPDGTAVRSRLFVFRRLAAAARWTRRAVIKTGRGPYLQWAVKRANVAILLCRGSNVRPAKAALRASGLGIPGELAIFWDDYSRKKFMDGWAAAWTTAGFGSVADAVTPIRKIPQEDWMRLK